MNELMFDVAKKLFPESHDIGHYLEMLFKHPEYAWFTPSNLEDESFSICNELAAVNLICSRKVPKWDNGSFKGYLISFLYLKDLSYSSKSL